MKIENFIIETSKKFFNPQKIILFGSRMRNDNIERSDYDFAFDAPDVSPDEWLLFKEIVEETAPTLLRIDLVLLSDTINESLKKRIFEEGRVIYERK